MPLPLSLVAQALQDLDSTTCYCGNEKGKGKSFCKRCYFSLPKKIQHDLYKHISEGYAEVYDEAKDFLRIEANIVPNKRLLP